MIFSTGVGHIAKKWQRIWQKAVKQKRILK